MEVSWLRAMDLHLKSECQMLGGLQFNSIWGQIMTTNEPLTVFSG